MAERITLPAALFPGLTDDKSGIVDLAKEYGVRLGKAQERISMATASPWAANALGLVESSPVLVLDRIVITTEGRPAEWRIAERVLEQGEYLALIPHAGGKTG